MQISKFSLLTYILTLFSVFGCASSPPVQPIIPAGAKSCKVHVFRDDFRSLWRMKISVRDQVIGELRDKTFLTFPVENGQHNILASWSLLSGNDGMIMPITCFQDENIYIAFTDSANDQYASNQGRQIRHSEASPRFNTYESIAN